MKKYSSGQILLAILIAIAVFAILVNATFTLIAASFDLVIFNKARITARHIAQERIEIIRNLPYDEVATIGGVPGGTLIPQSEVISRNGLNYTIETSIIYIDDGSDNTAPTDTSPEDYKRVRVEVNWEGLASSQRNPIVLITDISAEATTNIQGGSLIIQVIDANGIPVPQADITIVSSGITPSVDLTTQTDSSGIKIVPGMTPCIECYQITVTKSGFSIDRTYSTSEVTNPIKPPASIFLDDVTQISFAIDTLGTINITSVDSRENNFASLGNVPFILRGNKIIGTDAFAQPVYKYDQNLTTDAGGSRNLLDMEWDIYHVLMPAPTSYDISGTNPLLPLNLLPSGNIDFTFSTTAHTTNSFLLTVKDTSQNLIASASARLYDDGGFEEIKETGLDGNPDHGQTIFSNLTEQTYHLEATASGFLDFNQDFDISGTTDADVILTP